MNNDDIKRELQNSNYKSPKWGYRILIALIFMFLSVLGGMLVLELNISLLYSSLVFSVIYICIIFILFNRCRTFFKFPHSYFRFLAIIFLFFTLYGSWGTTTYNKALTNYYNTEEFKDIYSKVYIQFLLRELYPNSQFKDIVIDFNTMGLPDSIKETINDLIVSGFTIPDALNDSIFVISQKLSNNVFSLKSSIYNYQFLWYSNSFAFIFSLIVHLISLIIFAYKKYQLKLKLTNDY